MDIIPKVFCDIAHKEFDYLSSEFGFSVSEEMAEGCVTSAEVCYDSSKVTIEVSWNDRDGVAVMIVAKVDTFWIRPASSHCFNLLELLRMVSPNSLASIPQGDAFDYSEARVRPLLEFFARQLRTHGEPLLKGDVSLCEDVLITRYCNTSKGLPMDDYFKIFREECAVLPPKEREQIETALATRSARPIYFALDEFVHSRKLVTGRFLETLNDFWLQYFQ